MRTKDIYEATQWESGDVITSQRMQKIEDELEKHSKTIESTLDNTVWINVKDTETVVQVPTYNEFQMFQTGVYEHLQNTNLWTNGGYAISNGLRSSSELAVRSMLVLATDTFLPDNWGLITVDSDNDQSYGFRLHGWDASGNYMGFLVPSTYLWSKVDSDYVRAEMPAQINLDKVRDMYPNYHFKILVRGRSHDPAAGGTLNSVKELIHIGKSRTDVNLNQRIAAAGIAALTTVEHGEIPSYYTYTDSTHNSYMAEKATAINNLYSNNRIQFAFITDYHVNGYTSRGGQTGHSDTLLKYLADNTLVNMCVNGGDVVNEGSGWTGTVQNKVEFRNLMRDTCAKLRVPGMVTYFVAGNHDGGTHGNSGKAKIITEEELYTASGLQALRGHVIVDQTCPLQYYWDDPIHNVRYIVGALGLNNSAGTNLGTIVTEQTTEEAFAFITAALRTAPANCGIIIFNHMIIQTAVGKTISAATTPYYNITLLADLVDAYNARSSEHAVGSYATFRSDFSNCTGRVLAIIGGHSHIDYSYTTTNGVPIIVTTTDNAGGQLMLDNNNNTVVNAQRIDGNTTDFTVEQAFDVFTIDVLTGQIWATRIGGGADRTWNVTGVNN